MNYADIKHCDVANGPGVRVSLFVSGCTHHCKECFNPETWDFAYGKPFTEETVKQILDYFNLKEYFDEIVGSEMNGARTNKTEVIEETLKRLGLDHHREQVIMVGDKEHDVLGARKAGLDCVAVSYGYGTEEELAASQPLQIVASAEEILDFFA